ncbi:DUF4185 domain-containing protein [Nocardioides piscis]
MLVGPGQDARLHEAPLLIVASPVVSSALAERANALPDRPLAVLAGDAGDGVDAAEDQVIEGVVVAALVMDLSGTTDRLVLNASRDEELNGAVEDHVRQVLASNGRRVQVTRVSATTMSGERVSAAALASSAAGFAMALLVSVLLGPAPNRLRLGAGRVVTLVLVCGILGLVGASWLSPPSTARRIEMAAVVGLSILMPALLTLALGALAGLAGLAVGLTLFVVVASPLLWGIDSHLLPEPFNKLVDWTPAGATVNALDSVVLFTGTGLRQPLAVLMGWLVVAVVAMLVARRERVRAHVTLGDGIIGSRKQTSPQGLATAASSIGASPRGDADSPPKRRLTRRWRLRVAAVVLPSAIMVAGLVAFIPSDRSPSAAVVVDSAMQTPCVATGRVSSVSDLNRISARLRGEGQFEGGDVGASAALQDGRRLLVFGDTLRRLPTGQRTFVRNSMLLFDPGCIQAVLPADSGALIPNRAGTGVDVGYWPMSVNVATRPGYDLVSVMAQRVRSTGSGPFDFENIGPAVAVFIVPREGAPQLISVTDLGPDDADVTRPTWGAASVVEAGWTYLYGTAGSTEELTFGYSLHLARVRPDSVHDQQAWEYWTGTRWSRAEHEAVALIDNQAGTSQTLSVFERDGTWYALSKRDDFLGSKVTVWTGPHPWGPFDVGRDVAHLESNIVTGQLRYMPLAHPDLFARPGDVVVSYSRNRTDVGSIVNDPMQYRPRFLRVPLPDQ